MRSRSALLSILCIIALLVALLSCGGKMPTSDWPDTMAGRWMRDFMAAVNDEDDAAMRRFILDHYSDQYLAETPIEELLARLLAMKREMPPIEAGSVASTGEYSVSMVVHHLLFGVFFKLTLELAPEPPHDAKPFQEELIEASGGEPSLEIGEWETLEELIAQVREGTGAPALAVAVVRGDEVIDRAIVGSRRVDVDEPATIEDRFHIGSVTKSFTSMMIAVLVERGKLKWEMTIGEVLADLPMREEYRAVTLEQLVQHRGGLQPFPTGGEFADARTLPSRPPQEGRLALVKQVLQDEPIAEPGTSMNYSNAGYVVATTMAERVTGASWEVLIKSLVFEPLGLESAQLGWPATAEAPHQPWGHSGAPPDLQPHEPGTLFNFDLTTYLAPSGDVNCNITDLAEYASAHLQGLRGADGALSSASIVRLHTPPELDEAGAGYAAGWAIARTESGRPEHWHSGSGGSFFAVVSIYPEDDLAIVVLTNYGLPAEASLYQMMQAIYERLANT